MVGRAIWERLGASLRRTRWPNGTGVSPCPPQRLQARRCSQSACSPASGRGGAGRRDGRRRGSRAPRSSWRARRAGPGGGALLAGLHAPLRRTARGGGMAGGLGRRRARCPRRGRPAPPRRGGPTPDRRGDRRRRRRPRSRRGRLRPRRCLERRSAGGTGRPRLGRPRLWRCRPNLVRMRPERGTALAKVSACATALRPIPASITSQVSSGAPSRALATARAVLASSSIKPALMWSRPALSRMTGVEALRLPGAHAVEGEGGGVGPEGAARTGQPILPPHADS